MAPLVEPLEQHPRYRKIKDLNEGTFGFVQLALDLHNSQQVAIKFIERGAGVSKSVLREILNHRLCVVHPNIVQFREVLLCPLHLAIVMEFAGGGDMFEYVLTHKQATPGQGLPEDAARWFFQQLMLALEFCHELGIANRDIKLENSLLDISKPLPNIKICDFGYSKNEFVDSRPKTVSGTPDYIAPEVLLHDQYDGKTADIWSCGVMLYVMLTSVLPFAKRGDERTNNLVRLQQMFPRIINAEFQAPWHVSPECLHLLRAMLTADPSKRYALHLPHAPVDVEHAQESRTFHAHSDVRSCYRSDDRSINFSREYLRTSCISFTACTLARLALHVEFEGHSLCQGCQPTVRPMSPFKLLSKIADGWWTCKGQVLEAPHALACTDHRGLSWAEMCKSI